MTSRELNLQPWEYWCVKSTWLCSHRCAASGQFLHGREYASNHYSNPPSGQRSGRGFFLPINCWTCSLVTSNIYRIHPVNQSDSFSSVPHMVTSGRVPFVSSFRVFPYNPVLLWGSLNLKNVRGNINHLPFSSWLMWVINHFKIQRRLNIWSSLLIINTPEWKMLLVLSSGFRWVIDWDRHFTLLCARALFLHFSG